MALTPYPSPQQGDQNKHPSLLNGVKAIIEINKRGPGYSNKRSKE
jgi:hypothetical protein